MHNITLRIPLLCLIMAVLAMDFKYLSGHLKHDRNSVAAVNSTKFSCDTLPHMSIYAGNKLGQFPIVMDLFFVSAAQFLRVAYVLYPRDDPRSKRPIAAI